MPLTLYIALGSPPARAALMACKAAGVDVETKTVDLFNGEQHQDWFLKMNPYHTVPVLYDNGFYLWESRAIMRYILNAYSPANDLYPSDPKRRAMVDRALDEDQSINKPIGPYAFAQFVMGGPAPDDTELCKTLKDLDSNTPLAEGKYITGDTMTIADISTYNTVTFLELVNFDFRPYPNILAWITKVKAKPYVAEVYALFEQFKEYIKSAEFKAFQERLKSQRSAQK